MVLKNGDTIGVVALAGDCNIDKVLKGKTFLESLGFKVILAENVFSQDRYFAGTDDAKLKFLHDFFENPEISLILNARGGYGSIRLINKIDYELIKSNPKPFCGYSDITALLLMFYKKCGLITYHSPMLCSDFVKPSDFTMVHFFNAINGSRFVFSGSKIYNEGLAKGILWGGNLSTVVSMCGLDFIPNEDFIFFAEDLNEPVYKIDRMFQQLFNIEKFKRYCKAIVLGDFLDVDNEIWLDDLFSSFEIPTIGGMNITHGNDKVTFPVGKLAELDGCKLKV